jgi:hypothetical protein
MENGTETNRPETLTIDEEREAVAAAVAEFPEEFGLRGYPGKIFRVSPTASYYSPGWERDGFRSPAGVQVYTQVQDDDGGTWRDFAKGTVEELRREITRTPRYFLRRDEIEAEAERLGKALDATERELQVQQDRHREQGTAFDRLFEAAADELDEEDFYEIFGTYPPIK